MRKGRPAALLLLGLIVLPFSVHAVPDGSAEEEDRRSFLRHLRAPGREYLAARIARPRPADFLPLLTPPPEGVAAHRAKLVEGDLHLALGEREKALACYREAAAAFDGVHDEYAVEPSAGAGTEEPSDVQSVPFMPFTAGPGSHRDNWVLRRFIALEVWEDAAAEFRRVWEIHRARTCPHVITEPEWRAPHQAEEERRRVMTPAGFDGRALQFALDYAYFLRRRGDARGALAALLEPALEMDMDRNPSHPRREPLTAGAPPPYPERIERRPMSWGHSEGISRKEFLRLAYGEAKIAGQLGLFMAAVELRASWDLRARRVLARLRVLEGRLEEALAQEMSYIADAGFDPLSASVRRGMADEEAGKPEEAPCEYEEALTFPFVLPSIPDPVEEAFENAVGASLPRVAEARGFQVPEDALALALRQDLLSRLQRLYSAQGQTALALDAELRLLDLDDRSFADVAPLERAMEHFRTAGEEARLVQWARMRAARANDPRARASLSWIAGDRSAALEAAIEIAKKTKPERREAFDRWKELFRKTSREGYVALLETFVAANPGDSETRLELLDAKGIKQGPELRGTLRSLLFSERLPYYSQEKESYRTQFRGRFDLAYRLMLHYERAGEGLEIASLGLRILAGEAPFHRSEGAIAYPRRRRYDDSNRADLERCLSLVVRHLRRPEDIQNAERLIAATGSAPLINEFRRLHRTRLPRIDSLTNHRAPHSFVRVRTLGMPEGVRLFLNRDDVTAIAPGARWRDLDGQPGVVWTGTPWGLVRYREIAAGGLEIVQIVTGVQTDVFAETPAGLFAGTSGGLFRIDRPQTDNPGLVRIPLDEVNGYHWDAPEVGELLWWKDRLWVAASSGIHAYEPKRGRMRRYGGHDGGLFTGDGRLFTRSAVYEPTTDEFRDFEVTNPTRHLIGAAAGKVWALVDSRPAIFDPITAEHRVVPIALTVGCRPTATGFELLGEHEGQVYFSGPPLECIRPESRHRLDGAVVYDEGRGQLTAIRGPIPDEIRSLTDRTARAFEAVQLRLPDSYHGGGARAALLPGGRLIVGLQESRGTVVEDLSGGLLELNPSAGEWRTIGGGRDSLSSSQIHAVLRDGDRVYLGTNAGVAILSLAENAFAGRITTADRLPANCVSDLVRVGDQLYIACETSEQSGGLAVLDLATGTVRGLTRADGLASDAVRALHVDGDELHVMHPDSWSRLDMRTGLACSRLDTRTGRVVGIEKSHPEWLPKRTWDRPGMPALTRRQLRLWPEEPVDSDQPRVPVLGLALLESNLTGRVRPREWPRETVLVVRSRREALVRDAHLRSFDPKTPAQVRSALADPNPFFRARAASELSWRNRDLATQCIPALIALLSDSEPQVRGSALLTLSKLQLPESAIPALVRRLGDPVRGMRALAGLLLYRHGSPPEPSFLRDLFARGGWGRIPSGTSGTSDWAEWKEPEPCASIAAQADAPVFALLVEKPPSSDVYPPARDAIFRELGSSLLLHPEAAEALLAAYERYRAVPFAEAVFRSAGPEMLPLLHRALGSPDRVVRSNAARACGAIGDPSSIPPLLAALDLESGLSRASIVRALGLMRAREALPVLHKLFAESITDERRRQGAGFRSSQQGVEMREMYDSIANLDKLGAEWNDLKEAALPRPRNTRGGEELLSTQLILEAIRSIGPELSQEFYGTLAAHEQSEMRVHAAVRLAECAREDTERSVAVLKNLTADRDYSVRIAATVSLYILGEDIVRSSIRHWLTEGQHWEKSSTLFQLERVMDRSRLGFVRDVLDDYAKSGEHLVRGRLDSDEEHARICALVS